MTTLLKLTLTLFFCWHCLLMISFNITYLAEYDTEELEINHVAKKVFSWASHIDGIGYPENTTILKAIYRYGTLTGADSGYGFFSPNVPSEIAVFFEFGDAEGNIHTKPPILHSKYGMKRFTSSISSLRSLENLKPIIVRAWAVRMLEQFPESNSITVHIGTVRLPSMLEYQEGDRQQFLETSSYKFLLNT